MSIFYVIWKLSFLRHLNFLLFYWKYKSTLHFVAKVKLQDFERNMLLCITFNVKKYMCIYMKFSLWPNDKVGDHRDWPRSLSERRPRLGCLCVWWQASVSRQWIIFPLSFADFLLHAQRVRCDERSLISKCVSFQRASSLAFSWTHTARSEWQDRRGECVFSAWQNNLETKLSEWSWVLAGGFW